MKKCELAELTVTTLEKYYPSTQCALQFNNSPWKLMVMSRLSAQCTDKRVNEVSKVLFKKYKKTSDLAYADLKEVEEIIKPCGLFHMKAKDIISECKVLYEQYNNTLPNTIDELLCFPGIGRKIANLLVSEIYNKPAIVADTHCVRLSSRIGLTKKGEKNPLTTEITLKKYIEPEKQSDFCHRLVSLGREICTAKKPLCNSCPLNKFCNKHI